MTIAVFVTLANLVYGTGSIHSVAVQTSIGVVSGLAVWMVLHAALYRVFDWGGD